MDIRKAVDTIPILLAANPASLASLIPYAGLKRFGKGEHLFFDADVVGYVYFLVSGTAALYKLSGKHDKKVIFICGAGDLVNDELLDERPASINCEFLADSLVLHFDRRLFLYTCGQDFELARAVMDSMSLKIRRLYRQIKNTANNLRGDKRIAAKLWKLARDHGLPCEHGTHIGFNLTITYLADMLGSKRETVSRQLKLLTEQGLVLIDKNRFIIPDCDKLLNYFSSP